MTRKEYKAFGQQVADAIGAKSVSPHVGTWCDRAGVSIAIHMDSRTDGRRFIIHKWDNEETCSVRDIFGSFWRPRPNREGVEYGSVEDVAFTVEAITDAAKEVAIA